MVDNEDNVKEDVKQLWTVRNATLEDKHFILSTWLRGLRYGNDWFGKIDQDTYFRFYNQIIESVLSRPNTAVTVACLKDSPDVVLGYAVHNGEDVLHWVYVKRNWRKVGIAKALIPSDFRIVSHCTDLGMSILEKKYPKVKFNPFS